MSQVAKNSLAGFSAQGPPRLLVRSLIVISTGATMSSEVHCRNSVASGYRLRS